MDWKLPLNPAAGGRLLRISSLTAFALILLGDFGAARIANAAPLQAPTAWLPVIVTGPLIGLAVLGLPRAFALGRRVVGAVTISLALTVWTLIDSSGLQWWGALETCGLLFLTIRTTAHAWRPARATAATVALCVAVLMLPLRSGSWSAFVAGGYILTVALAICVATGCALRAMELRRERAVHDVRQAERLALARDLHDLIAHHMTGIIVQANAAVTIQGSAPDQVDPLLRNIARSGTETLESMRRLVGVLREDNHAALRPGDLLTELADLVSAHCAHTSADASGANGANGAFDALDAPDASGTDTPARLDVAAAARTARLSPEVEISVLRLVQEALTNVRRHACGARATVRLDAEPGWLRVTVTNTAAPHRGTAPAGGRGGFGLLGLRERVEALDGTLRTGALPQGGWQVEAAFPLATAAADVLQDHGQGR
ncbi:sensor histidine kinase [Streptomyces sp. NPDC127108]|uniref:sensor histidine kinase n=1 Tax=Streptomyces sp. NPDC127108 TaxID=3345361 RepID=UPI0036333A12